MGAEIGSLGRGKSLLRSYFQIGRSRHFDGKSVASRGKVSPLAHCVNGGVRKHRISADNGNIPEISFGCNHSV